VEIIAEVNTAESFETFAETVNTGHGLIGTTHADDVESLVNRVVEQGLPAYLLRELDLVVFPRYVGGERYVGEVVELLTEAEYEALADRTEAGVVRKDGTAVYWNRVVWRTTGGEFGFAYDHPELGDDDRRMECHVFDRLARETDRSVGAVEDEFHRKHRYVRHLVQQGVDDFEALFDLLADLRTNEAATVERLSRRAEGASDD
jgi:hypothetical protein